MENTKENKVDTIDKSRFDIQDKKFSEIYYFLEQVRDIPPTDNIYAYNREKLDLSQKKELAFMIRASYLFYNSYIKKWGNNAELFLPYIESEKIKLWVTYFCKYVSEMLYSAEQKYRDRLNRISSQLGFPVDNYVSFFEKGGPYLTLDNYIIPGIYKIRKPYYQYYYILVIDWMLTRLKNATVQSFDYEKKIKNAQIRFMNQYIFYGLQDNKKQCIKRIVETFQRIDTSGFFEIPLLSINEVASNSYKFHYNGCFLLNWENVHFYDGYLELFHPLYPNGEKEHNPLRIKEPTSRKVFEKIKTFFILRIECLYVYAENDVIQKIINKNNLMEYITLFESRYVMLEKIKSMRKSVNSCGHKEKVLLKKSEIDNLFKEQKTEFLDYLGEHQLKTYNVVCFPELRINSEGGFASEYAFIFTLKEKNDRLLIAFENIYKSRCSYLFIIKKNNWDAAVHQLYDYFTSTKMNKREALVRGETQLNFYKPFSYVRVMHTDFLQWSLRIRKLAYNL